MRNRIVIVFILVVVVVAGFMPGLGFSAIEKVLMVIPNNNFRDEEFDVTYKTLIREGYNVTVVSTMLNTAIGMLGMKVDPDVLLAAVKSKDYDAIVFIGGTGTQDLWNDLNAQQLAKDMNRDGKLVAAISIAPVILAKAGVLKGKKATVSQPVSHILDFDGANYTCKSVEVDKNIITADGPSSAQEFADAIVTKLNEDTTYGTK